ncbi:MAG: hypothetical protein WC725_04900 [Patescibacteria group bacterium]
MFKEQKRDYRSTILNILKRHPQLCQKLIVLSIGYLTPNKAADMIRAYQQKTGCYCEWISSIVDRRINKPIWKTMTPTERHDFELSEKQMYATVTKELICDAIRLRKQTYGAKQAKEAINAQLTGTQVLFASFF